MITPARALGRAGGKADQRVADVADGRVGHQPLDVGLADGGEGAEAHRGDGEATPPAATAAPMPAKAPSVTRISSAMAASLGRGGEEGGDRRRRALVDVGRPHVERHGGDLEGEADQQEHEADDQADVLRRRRSALRGRGDGGEARSSR